MNPLPALTFVAFLSATTLLNGQDATPQSPPTLRETVDALSEADLKEFPRLLKDNYLKPEALSDQALSRATIQGMIERLAPGVSIQPAPATGTTEVRPFKSEILENNIGYLRLGSLLAAHLEQLDTALADFTAKKVDAAVLDLRATPAGSEFQQGAEVCRRFCPKGRILFTVRKPNAQHEEILTSKEEPKFSGLIVALVDEDTAGAAEIIAAVLRTQAGGMIIGQRTRGEAVEFAEVPLPSGKLLRVAVAEAALPDSTPVFPGGVKPDLAVTVTPEATAAALQHGLEHGVAALVLETERSKMNEAALIARRNPELEALQAAQANKGEKPKPVLRDLALQRAVDFVTTVRLYERKSGRARK